jgi:hypothetical protein
VKRSSTVGRKAGTGKETTGGVGGTAFIQRNKKNLSNNTSVQEII